MKSLDFDFPASCEDLQSTSPQLEQSREKDPVAEYLMLERCSYGVRHIAFRVVSDELAIDTIVGTGCYVGSASEFRIFAFKESEWTIITAPPHC